MGQLKAIRKMFNNKLPHWVGDGFFVRSLFSYDNEAELVSPFLLLDHTAPLTCPPSPTHKRGVGVHPHRGFETVTIVYQGDVEHRDSTGSGGQIGPGDVQWMTAGSGILHEEYHGAAFGRTGGTMEMVQLWVNLPSSAKMTPPRYQTLLSNDIPVVHLPQDAGRVRVIAGSFHGHTGPAQTVTPIGVWDVKLSQDGKMDEIVPEGYTVVLVVLDGTILVSGEQVMRAGSGVLLDRSGDGLSIEANGVARVLVLLGEPIDEPVVGMGPFVMNTAEEINQAVRDFQDGRFGRM